MGKYMRKAKMSGDVAVMEVSSSHQSPLGVRTRARTLALLSLQSTPPDLPSPACYLELRSRRLEKATAPPPPSPEKKNPCSFNSVSEVETDGGLEVSFGENVLELEVRDRNARETTPCSLIRNSEPARTPGSTSRPSSRPHGISLRRDIPTAIEMEEFFARAEQLQHTAFVEKYNFDPASDRPLPGRYEWVEI